MEERTRNPRRRRDKRGLMHKYPAGMDGLADKPAGEPILLICAKLLARFPAGQSIIDEQKITTDRPEPEISCEARRGADAENRNNNRKNQL